MTRANQLASARVPASLDEFQAGRLDPEDGAIAYRIACACGTEHGAIISEYDPAEDFWVDPLAFDCPSCGRSATFFDSRRHGYDAVLNDFSAYKPRARDEQVPCRGCGGRRHGLVGLYSYEIEDDEIEEDWAESERARMPDLFTGVAFRLTCAECGEVQQVGGWECA